MFTIANQSQRTVSLSMQYRCCFTQQISFHHAFVDQDCVHRRRSSVNFGGGQDIFAQKINKMPEFYTIFAWKK